MSNRFPVIAIALSLCMAVLSSCSGSDAPGTPSGTSDIPISFTALTHWDTPQTRLAADAGSNATPFTTGDAFSLFAYHNDSSTPDFMNNQRVAYNGAAWTYSPVKYWPKNDGDRLSFYAASPYSAVENGDISVSASADGHPTMTYDNTRADIDWTVAKSGAVTYDNGKDGVPLAFSHLTARVQFRFTVVGETEDEDYRPVVHLLQYDVPHITCTTRFEEEPDGSFACTCTDNGDLVTLRRFVSRPEGINVSKAGTTIDDFTAYLFPCSFPCNGDAATKGTFTISLNNIAYTVTPDEQIDVERGKSYTVNFNIQKTENSSNFFIASYSIWEDGGEYEGTLE